MPEGGYHVKCFYSYFLQPVLKKSFNTLILSHGVYLPLLAWPWISVLFVPHIGWGGADNISWDHQPGGISLKARWS